MSRAIANISTNRETSLTRRAAVLSVAAVAASGLPALAAPPTIDPIYSAIENYKLVNDELGDAIHQQSVCEEAEFARKGGSILMGRMTNFLDKTESEVRAYSHGDINSLWGHHQPNRAAALRDELDAEKERHRLAMAPSNLRVSQAHDLEIEALDKMLTTVPTTMDGLVALLTFLAGEMENGNEPIFEADHINDLLSSSLAALSSFKVQS